MHVSLLKHSLVACTRACLVSLKLMPADCMQMVSAALEAGGTARRLIVRSLLRLVVQIAKSMHYAPGVELDDLVTVRRLCRASRLRNSYLHAKAQIVNTMAQLAWTWVTRPKLLLEEEAVSCLEADIPGCAILPGLASSAQPGRILRLAAV